MDIYVIILDQFSFAYSHCCFLFCTDKSQHCDDRFIFFDLPFFFFMSNSFLNRSPLDPLPRPVRMDKRLIVERISVALLAHVYRLCTYNKRKRRDHRTIERRKENIKCYYCNIKGYCSSSSSVVSIERIA